MKKALLTTVFVISSLIGVPAVYAQDQDTTVPSYSNTVESTPAPTEKTDVNVNVEAPEPKVVQAPAPDVNVHVDSPGSVAVPSSSTEKTTKETSVTKIVQTPVTDDSSNMAFLLVGGGIAALAVAGLFASSRR